MSNDTPALDRRKPGDRMLACLAIPGLTYRERVVLAALAYHDGPGGAYPSLQTLADECGMPRSRASETVGALCDKGRLIRQRWRTTNRYRVVFDCPENPYSEAHCTENPDSENRASLSGFPGSDCPENPDTNWKEQEVDLQHGGSEATRSASARIAASPSIEVDSTEKPSCSLSLSPSFDRARESESERESNSSFARRASNGKGSPATPGQRRAIEMRLGAKYGDDIPDDAWPWLESLTVAQASHVIRTKALSHPSAMERMMDTIKGFQAQRGESQPSPDVDEDARRAHAKAAGTGKPAPREPEPEPEPRTGLRFNTHAGPVDITIAAVVKIHTGASAAQAWEILETVPSAGPFCDQRDVRSIIDSRMTRAGFPRRDAT